MFFVPSYFPVNNSNDMVSESDFMANMTREEVREHIAGRVAVVSEHNPHMTCNDIWEFEWILFSWSSFGTPMQFIRESTTDEVHTDVVNVRHNFPLHPDDYSIHETHMRPFTVQTARDYVNMNRTSVRMFDPRISMEDLWLFTRIMWSWSPYGTRILFNILPPPEVLDTPPEMLDTDTQSESSSDSRIPSLRYHFHHSEQHHSHSDWEQNVSDSDGEENVSDSDGEENVSDYDSDKDGESRCTF